MPAGRSQSAESSSSQMSDSLTTDDRLDTDSVGRYRCADCGADLFDTEMRFHHDTSHCIAQTEIEQLWMT